MARIRGDRLGPETAVDAALRSLGFRPQRNRRDLPGSPDFALPWRRVAIFVHGCFWHGCPKHYRLPKTRQDYWIDKWVQNKRRDRRVERKLRQGGWSVIVVWEHDTRRDKSALKRLLRHRLDLVRRSRARRSTAAGSAGPRPCPRRASP